MPSYGICPVTELAGPGFWAGRFWGAAFAGVRRLRDGGAYLGVMPHGEPASVRGVRTSAVQVVADGAQLAGLVKLMEEGVLTTRVAGTYALEEAGAAHARFAEGGVGGTLVLVP